MAETQAGYVEYMKNTSPFFPWFPGKNPGK